MKSTAGSTVRGRLPVPRNRRAVLAASAAVASRPGLWRVALALVPRGWWRRWPPVPAPPGDYRRFRAETMYGDASASVSADDLVAYLEWCRGMRQRAR